MLSFISLSIIHDRALWSYINMFQIFFRNPSANFVIAFARGFNKVPNVSLLIGLFVESFYRSTGEKSYSIIALRHYIFSLFRRVVNRINRKIYTLEIYLDTFYHCYIIVSCSILQNKCFRYFSHFDKS